MGVCSECKGISGNSQVFCFFNQTHHQNRCEGVNPAFWKCKICSYANSQKLLFCSNKKDISGPCEGLKPGYWNCINCKYVNKNESMLCWNNFNNSSFRCGGVNPDFWQC